MMTGASSQHDRITSNVMIALDNQLNGSPCWPATADLALRTKIRSLRRADVLVTCDEPSLNVYEAQDPKMVVEVLSPSNKGLTWQRKIEEYRQHAKLVYLLLIELEREQATLIVRDGDKWLPSDFDGRDGMIELPADPLQPRHDRNLSWHPIPRRNLSPELQREIYIRSPP